MNKKQLDLMRNYQQVDYAEYLLSHPIEFNDYAYFRKNLNIVSLYLRDKEKLPPRLRQEKLYSLVKDSNVCFNIDVDYKKIDTALHYSTVKKHELKQIELPRIYESEYQYIFNLPLLDVYKKLLFTVFCFYKLKNALYPGTESNYYLSSFLLSLPKLKRSSGISLKKGETIGYLFYDLEAYIDYTAFREGKIIAPFVAHVPEPSQDERFYELKDFEHIGYYYRAFCGDKKIGFCANCGFPYLNKNKTAQRHKCDDCQKQEQKEKEIYFCESCGETFIKEPTMRRKKCLCNQCYSEYRSSYMAQKENSHTSKKVL